MNNITFTGAQIPVSHDLKENISTIKRAIDYAYADEADYLVTPEGSLSGYITDFDTRDGRTRQDLEDALKEVVAYAKDKQVGLFLGTMWLEDEDTEAVRRNQIRVYNKQGEYINHINKTLVNFDYELVEPSRNYNPVFLPEAPTLHILPMICNDMWGSVMEKGPCLPVIAEANGCHLIIHSTNALKKHMNNILSKTFDDWHNAWLQMMSLYTKVPIITCDSCYEMDGTIWDGPTSSQSGVVSHGLWKEKVPRIGEQYFTYKFDLVKLLFNASETDFNETNEEGHVK